MRKDEEVEITPALTPAGVPVIHECFAILDAPALAEKVYIAKRTRAAPRLEFPAGRETQGLVERGV